MLQLDFWSKFREYVQSQKGDIKLRKPYPQHWYDISFGFSTAHIALTVNSQLKQIACELYIPDSNWLFLALFENRETIENELGESLEWNELPDKKASRIKLVSAGDIFEQNKWFTYYSWLLKKVVAFQNVFSSRIKSLI